MKGYVSPKNAEKNPQAHMITPDVLEPLDIGMKSVMPNKPSFDSVDTHTPVNTMQAEYLRTGPENGKPLP